METVANKNFSFTSTWPLGDLMSIMIFDSFPREVACVASVSNRVIARKLERKQNFVPLPLPRHSVIFCSCPSFLDEPREETLATQATREGVACSF